MTHGFKVLGLGCVVAWSVVACSPSRLSLGDEPLGEAGQGGSVAPSTSGSGGTSQAAGQGGAAPGPGGTSQAGQGGAASGGSGGTPPDPPVTGGAGPDDDCYAPELRPELSLVEGAQGCACNGAQAECVRFSDQGRPHDMAFYCIDDRWQLAEDGVCGGIEAECRVRGVDYPSNSRRIVDVDSCNRCDCKNGRLTSCTEINCPMPCPEGSWKSRRCVDCGTGPGGCGVYETGCFTDPSCESGECTSGAICI